MQRQFVSRRNAFQLLCLLTFAASACTAEIGPSEGEPTTDLLTLASWTACADEGSFCEFSGTRSVRYGANNRFTEKTFTDGVQCDGKLFGVKRRGSAKCELSPVTNSADDADNTVPTSDSAAPAATAPAANSGDSAGTGSAADSGDTQAGSPAPESPAAAADMVISSALRADKTTVRAGETLTASVTYTNRSSVTVTVSTIAIAGRKPGATHAAGPYDDLAPTQSATTLAAGASVTLTASRTFGAADATGQWEAYSTYQDANGAWHDGPSIFFSVAASSAAPVAPAPTTATTTAPSSSNTMKIGTNFWYHSTNEDNWSGETSMKSGIDWATAYGSGTNGLADTNIWNETFLSELAPYSTLRFMDWGNTNFSKITSWSQRRLPTDNGNYAVYIDASSPANNPGVAYEWMIDLVNRTHKDLWICVPAQADENYWTQLASLIKNKLQADRKVYVEYSNENWNGSFGQFQYTIDRGVAQGLPGPNEWYKGQAYAVWTSLKIFKAFEDVFGASAMGSRVIRVFAYGGNMDTGRQALESVYKSAVYNPNNQKIDMLAIAPYVGSSLDGASPSIQSEFHHAIDEHASKNDDGSLGMITFAVEDAKTFGIPKLGTYEGGQHLLKNSMAWTSNPKIYDEYQYMLQRYSQYFSLFMHYSHTGKWTNADGQSSWGSLDHTGQSISEAHKYRALVDWVKSHP
jgi:hypothetical protein